MIQAAITSTAIVCKDKWFVNTLNELMNYARGFKLQYRLLFIDARTMDLTCDTDLSSYLPTRSRGMYNIHARVAKLLIRYENLLHLPVAFKGEGSTKKPGGIWHLGTPVLYISETYIVILLLQTPNLYVTKPMRTNHFHALTFYTADRALLALNNL